jgi:putative DNA primase/helicase
MMTAASIARALGGRKVGGQWMACCPAHDDKNPSLALRDQDGKALFRCHAGCAQDAVREALKALGLWESERSGLSFEERIVCAYDYTDEYGSLLYQVVRFREPKDFMPRRPDGHGGWIWGYGDVRRVPYHLLELIEAAIVFLPEGEKDCDALREFGFVATTNPGGSNAWRDEFNAYFRGKEVIILADADPPGWKRALHVARGIVGIAAKVQMIELPGAKDAAEWFAKGHSELELIELVEKKSECRNR